MDEPYKDNYYLGWISNFCMTNKCVILPLTFIHLPQNRYCGELNILLQSTLANMKESAAEALEPTTSSQTCSPDL